MHVLTLNSATLLVIHYVIRDQQILSLQFVTLQCEIQKMVATLL